MGFFEEFLSRKKMSQGSIPPLGEFWDKKDLVKNLGKEKYSPQHQVIKDPRQALTILRGGGMVVMPTDTIYGLAVRVRDEHALNRIFRLKGRSLERQIPILIEDPEKTVPELVEEIPEIAKELMKIFWPGPLTLVFKAKKGLPRLITGNKDHIGLRQSSHPLVRSLIRALGEPLTGTSANLSGLPSPFGLEQISPSLLQGADFVIDGGALGGRKGSTVLDFTGKEIKITRQGDLPLSRIQEYIQL